MMFNKEIISPELIEWMQSFDGVETKKGDLFEGVIELVDVIYKEWYKGHNIQYILRDNNNELYMVVEKIYESEIENVSNWQHCPPEQKDFVKIEPFEKTTTEYRKV